MASSGEACLLAGEGAETSTPAAQLMQRLEALSLRFAGEGLATYARKTGQPQVDANDPWPAICRQLHAAAGLPAIEADFSEPWSSEAKAVLAQQQLRAPRQAIWGPVLAYCVLEGMAEASEAKTRQLPRWHSSIGSACASLLARAFSLGGEITEDGWRAAARVRLAFLERTLTPAKAGKAAADDAFAGLPRGIWDDANARWLLKVHEAGGEWYFNKELHQQMLWWTQLPDLLELAGPTKAPAPVKAGKSAPKSTVKSIESIEQSVEDACEQAEESGYRIGKKKEPAAKPVKREKGALAK